MNSAIPLFSGADPGFDLLEGGGMNFVNLGGSLKWFTVEVIVMFSMFRPYFY